MNSNQVDRTALKFRQGSTVFLLCGAILYGAEWLVGLLALIMLIGAAIPRANLFALLYKVVIQPLGILEPDPSKEASAPHQFAQGVGGGILFLAFVTLNFVQLPFLGWALVSVVIALGLLNLVSNFCLGCFLFFRLKQLGVLR